MPFDLETQCGGMGWLDCYCGGDLCVCTLNGGTDCDGCPDCEDDDAAKLAEGGECPDDCPECSSCYESNDPLEMGWIGKDGKP
jgi:hypothetical protein